jgi:penicillin-binding protein 1A
VSAKTGTSGSGYTSYDNWTVGWTPNILTCVWVGNPQGYQPQYALSNITSGLTGAAPIWQVYMEGATAGTPIVWYKTPSDVYQEGGSWFLPGTSPSTGTSICNPNCVTPTAAPTATPTAAPTAAPTPSG